MSALADFQDQMTAALFDPNTSMYQRVGAGLGVYQNTVIKGLIDALRANYPTVERLLGAEWFDAVSRVYACQHLPTQPSLALYGEAFADFLHEFPDLNEWPYLPFVARLDRHWLEAHFAIDAAVLRAAQLQQLPAESLANVQLQLHPAARLAQLPYSAVSIWQSNRPPATPPAALNVTGEAEYVLVSRPDGEISVSKLNEAEYSFIQQISAGATLGEAAVQTLQHHATADIAAMLATFIGAGAFFTDFEVNQNRSVSGE